MSKPVLLGLSSFRWKEAEISSALELAAEMGAPLLTVFVVDVNLARYFTHTGVMAGTTLREQMEHGLLEEHRKNAREILDRVCAMASASGIACETRLETGRFAQVIKAIASEAQPEVVLVTRAQRPEWLRRLFGSPVDEICDSVDGTCDVRIVK